VCEALSLCVSVCLCERGRLFVCVALSLCVSPFVPPFVSVGVCV
jgi:hypothetical protein